VPFHRNVGHASCADARLQTVPVAIEVRSIIARQELDMNIPHFKFALSAVLAMTAASQVHADVGIMDGADSFRDFQSTKSRAEVRSELENGRAQAYPVTDGTGFNDSKLGAHGVAGSRYSTKTREEVNNELREYQRTHQPGSTNDIYFGG
jgi:hypothetical protein